MNEGNKIDSNIGYLTLLHAGHGVHHGDWNFPTVYSPFVRLYYCDGGEAFTMVQGKIYTLRPGYLYLMPPFTIYSDWNTGYFSHYYMHIYIYQELGRQSIFELMDLPIEVKASDCDVQYVKRIIEINSGITLPKPLSNPKVYDNQETLINRLKSSMQQPMWQTSETNGLLLVLLSKFMRHAQQQNVSVDERIKDIVVYIRMNLDKKLSTKDLAMKCFLSSDHFERLFKQDMNCTPTEYVKKVKIEAAETMLAMRNMSVKDIAYSLAFDSPSYFNKVFKSVTGITPAAYKKKITEASAKKPPKLKRFCIFSFFNRCSPFLSW
jgi:AraC-like DNA-binding protein